MKIINVDNWERKTQFSNFSKYTNPIFSIAVRLDVTNLVLFCEEKKYSFFPVFLYIVAKCSNQVPEMKIRIEKGEVVQYNVVHPSYVILRDDKCIATSLTDFDEDFEKFYTTTKKNIAIKKKDTGIREFNSKIRTDCLYISSLQWLDITAISDPYNFESCEQTSIPRIAWGKYVRNSDGKYEMGFNVSAHHGLMDGWHVAQLVEKIQKTIENINDFLR